MKSTTKTDVKKKKKKKEQASNVPWSSTEDFTRKYRPPRIDDVVGQPIMKSMFKGMVRKHQIPGALLVFGLRGSGKTTFSRIVASTLNCQSLGDDGNTCGKCDSCQAHARGSHPDHMEINAASNTGIDNARSVLDSIAYKPRYNFKVVTWDEVHMLSKAACDALLKDIEEPKPHVRHILLTTEPHKLPDTLVSRCVKVKIAEISTKHNVELLRRVCDGEKLNLPDEVLEMVCLQANNIPRECLTTLQALSYVIASGDIETKNVTPEKLSMAVADIVGMPSYVAVGAYLSGIYSGKFTAAVKILGSVQSKPNFLKSCIDVHSNVVMCNSTKTPETVISEKWVLGNTMKLIRESGVVRSEATSKNMQAMLSDMIDMFSKMGQYQLGDSSSGLVAIAAKYAQRFKE